MSLCTRLHNEHGCDRACLQDAPHRSIAPEAALARQLQALRDGDTPSAFAFASPANQRATGPLDRFAALLDAPTYRPLSHHLESEVRCVPLVACRRWCIAMMSCQTLFGLLTCKLLLSMHAYCSFQHDYSISQVRSAR